MFSHISLVNSRHKHMFRAFSQREAVKGAHASNDSSLASASMAGSLESRLRATFPATVECSTVDYAVSYLLDSEIESVSTSELQAEIGPLMEDFPASELLALCEKLCQLSASAAAINEESTHSNEDPEDEDTIRVVSGTRGRFVAPNSKDVNLVIDMALNTTDLLVSAPLKLNYGKRYALIGKNGSGKSTLLDRIARGLIRGFPTHLRIHHVHQHLSSIESPRTVLQELLGDVTIANPVMAQAHESLLSCGFAQAQFDTPCKQLSGGWHMRLQLAIAHFHRPDILLLDEPSNHLDLAAALWLRAHLLSKYSGTLVLVSHDRALLRAVCTDVIHLHKQTLANYPCGFDAFLQVRSEKLKKQQWLQEDLDRRREQVEKSIANMSKAAKSNPADAKRMGQVASRKKKLMRMGIEKTEDGKKWNCQEHGMRLGSYNSNSGGWKNGKMTATPIVEAPDAAFHFKFECAAPLGTGGALLTLENVNFAYAPVSAGARPALEHVTVQLLQRTRAVVLGRNGSGKSTLLRLLAGLQAHSSGTLTRQRNCRVAFFEQHHLGQLDDSLTPLEQLAKLALPATIEEGRRRAHLASFGLTAAVATHRIGTLSGGQRARMAFACVTFPHEPHILVLDEPTNHLDFDTIESLIAALRSFEGAVIVASHDAYLIESLGEECELLVVANRRVAPWKGTFASYQTSLVKK